VERLKELALVQVLCYSFDEPSSLSVRQLSRCGAEFRWDKYFVKETKTVNLHIFAEEPIKLSGRWMSLLHPSLAFREFVSLVGLDLGFQYPLTWEGPTELAGAGVAGVPTVQLLSQSERSAFVNSQASSQDTGIILFPFNQHAEGNCLGGLVFLPIHHPDPVSVGTTVDGFRVDD
jgi:hypothetical protein